MTTDEKPDELLDGSWRFAELLVAAGHEPRPRLVELTATWSIRRLFRGDRLLES